MPTREEIGTALKRAMAAAKAGDPAAAVKARTLAKAYKSYQEPAAPAPEAIPQGMFRNPHTGGLENQEQRMQRLNAMAAREPKADPTAGPTSIAPAGIEALRFNVPESVGNAAAGMGSSFMATGRQARRLGNLAAKNIPGISHLTRFMGFNPEENLEKLDEETAEARRLEEPLMNTTAGKAGRIGGDVAQALALTAATGGLGGGAIAGGGGRALANVVARDAAAGGIQGALQDTGKGESIGKNIAMNAALGAAIPGAGAGLRKAKQISDEIGVTGAARLGVEGFSALPWIGAPTRGLLHIAEKRAGNKLAAHELALKEYNMDIAPLKTAHTEAKNEAKALAKVQTAQANKAAGEAHKAQVIALNQQAKKTAKEGIEEITSSVNVPITPQLALKARNLKSKFGGVLKDYPDLARALDQMTIQNAKMPGKIAASIKSSAGEAARATRDGKQALHEIERFFNDSIMDNLAPKRAEALRGHFESYGKGVREELLPPKPAHITVKPNVPDLVLPPRPQMPGTGPYTRSKVQAARTAAVRGAALRRDRKEK